VLVCKKQGFHPDHDRVYTVSLLVSCLGVSAFDSCLAFVLQDTKGSSEKGRVALVAGDPLEIIDLRGRRD
jgi:hypothetical protein